MPIAQSAGAVEITLFRFFGDCANEYASVNNVDEATGECGIIQALTNQFNAENQIGATVVTQTVDWGTYYDLLSATYASDNIPTSPSCTARCCRTSPRAGSWSRSARTWPPPAWTSRTSRPPRGPP
jgi:hypothetical protein